MDRTVAHGGPDLGLQAGDRAGLVGVDRLLHLHRLADDDEVTLGDLLALLDGELDGYVASSPFFLFFSTTKMQRLNVSSW